MAPSVIYSKKSDSPGYTRYYLDEPIGSGQNGVKVVGPVVKLHESRTIQDDKNNFITQDEAPFELVLHGQEQIEVPNDIKELKFEDGSTLKLGSKSES